MVSYGRYVVVHQLGQGEFAAVYRARDTMLSRKVALKVLLEHRADSADMRERFLAEARALANLQHPNIITIHDVGVAGDRPYFAMELVEGSRSRPGLPGWAAWSWRRWLHSWGRSPRRSTTSTGPGWSTATSSPPT